MSDGNQKGFPEPHREKSCTLSEMELLFTNNELDEYTTARCRDLSPKSNYWLHKVSEIIWSQTEGVVSQTTMTRLRNYALTKFTSTDSWGKILNFARAFLKYLSKLHLDPSYQNFTLFLDMPKSRKDRKTVTSRVVTVSEISQVVNGILDAYNNKFLTYESMINYVWIT